MQPVVIRISAAVEIEAHPAAIFALVCDAKSKAKLNPFIQVIRIEREDDGPLRRGSVTFYRLQKGTHIFEYRMRCIRFEPGWLIESRAELPSMFAVRLEVEPAQGGSRLTQIEECEVSQHLLEALPLTRRAERAWRFMKTLNFFLPEIAHETYPVILRERAHSLRVSMQRELQGWLHAIKAHVESGDRYNRSLTAKPGPLTDTGSS
ncbi:MAG TPA: SRPBCC family protein [Syntrophobacteria bacterium]|nr:SRPBCC family protein [Syntrophobacteria bacterium]